MFKHYLENIHTENEDFLNKIGYDEETDYIPRSIFSDNINSKLFYFESIRNNDLESVKLLLYSGSVDINCRVRFNTIRRTTADMIALKEAINAYSLEVAQFLIDMGHDTKGFTITFSKENDNNLFYESQKKAKQFCIDNCIDFKEE